MITKPNEYWSLLYRIQDLNSPLPPECPIPSDKNIYNIDLNSRTIETPEFIAVQGDDDAEYIFFRCPRFFDHIDLTQECCIIQYINANGDPRLYPVPFYDAVTEGDEGNILIPWHVGGDATAYEGTLEFAIRFYHVDPDTHSFIYCLNTQPAETEVLRGIDTTGSITFDYTTTSIEEILSRIARVEQAYNLYWLEVKGD